MVQMPRGVAGSFVTDSFGAGPRTTGGSLLGAAAVVVRAVSARGASLRRSAAPVGLVPDGDTPADGRGGGDETTTGTWALDVEPGDRAPVAAPLGATATGAAEVVAVVVGQRAP